MARIKERHDTDQADFRRGLAAHLRQEASAFRKLAEREPTGTLADLATTRGVLIGFVAEADIAEAIARALDAGDRVSLARHYVTGVLWRAGYAQGGREAARRAVARVPRCSVVTVEPSGELICADTEDRRG